MHQPIAWSFRRNLSRLCVAEADPSGDRPAATERRVEQDALRGAGPMRAEPAGHAAERHRPHGD